LKKAFNSLPKDTSPGYPLNLKFKNKGEAKYEAQAWAQNIINMLKWESVEHVLSKAPPCYAAARRAVQKQGADKSRLVWAYPQAVSLIENIYAQPLMEELRKTELFGWSINYLNSDGAMLYRNMRGVRLNQNTTRFGLDWTSYDSRVQSKAIRWAFSLLRSLLHLDKHHRKVFKFVEEYFINTPLLYRRRMYRKSSGVPSGSTFTQMIDSLVNMYIHTDLILSVSLNKRTTWDEIYDYSNFLGDDSIVRLTFCLDRSQVKRMIQLALDHHDMELSIKKSWFIYSDVQLMFDEDNDPDLVIHYLGKQILSPLDIEADYEKVVAAAKLPERPDKGPESALTRLIGLAWSSGTSRKIFTFLRGQFANIVKLYPRARPAPFTPADRRWLSLVTRDTHDLLRFPSWQELLSRYAKGR
jgi:hypothetical protein